MKTNPASVAAEGSQFGFLVSQAAPKWCLWLNWARWALTRFCLQTLQSKRGRHSCSKKDSLIWNKLRAQLHGSVHPTHSVTLMGGGEQEKQPGRSQSARPKKQERLKKKAWNAQPKPSGVTFRGPGLPHLLTQAPAGTRRSLPSQGSPASSLTSPAHPATC